MKGLFFCGDELRAQKIRGWLLSGSGWPLTRVMTGEDDFKKQTRENKSAQHVGQHRTAQRLYEEEVEELIRDWEKY
jgi:hypothetical protein